MRSRVWRKSEREQRKKDAQSRAARLLVTGQSLEALDTSELEGLFKGFHSDERRERRASGVSNRELAAPIRNKNMREARKRLLAGCVDCKVQFSDLRMYDFDHVPERGPKRESVNRASRFRGHKTFLIEINKCDVVCPTCHRKRTLSRRGAIEETSAWRNQ